MEINKLNNTEKEKQVAFKKGKMGAVFNWLRVFLILVSFIKNIRELNLYTDEWKWAGRTC